MWQVKSTRFLPSNCYVDWKLGVKFERLTRSNILFISIDAIGLLSNLSTITKILGMKKFTTLLYLILILSAMSAVIGAQKKPEWVKINPIKNCDSTQFFKIHFILIGYFTRGEFSMSRWVIFRPVQLGIIAIRLVVVDGGFNCQLYFFY